MADLLAFNGQLFGFGIDPTDPGASDLNGKWTPVYDPDTRKQVVRGLVGQPVQIVLDPLETYPLLTGLVQFYLDDDPDDPDERACQVNGDNRVTYTLPAHLTARLAPRTYQWEVWDEDQDRPLASGSLVLGSPVRSA